ncbi:hypothetical protein RY27_21800, partial [Litorilinea aerophila]
MATVTWKHALQQARRSGVGPYLARLGTYALPLVLAAALWATWQLTARPIHVTVDGIQEQVWTHRRTVAALLLDLALTLQPQDRVSPPPDTPLQRDMTITVQRARPVRLLVDGRDLQIASWGETPAQILADAGEYVDRYGYDWRGDLGNSATVAAYTGGPEAPPEQHQHDLADLLREVHEIEG